MGRKHKITCVVWVDKDGYLHVDVDRESIKPVLVDYDETGFIFNWDKPPRMLEVGQNANIDDLRGDSYSEFLNNPEELYPKFCRKMRKAFTGRWTSLSRKVKRAFFNNASGIFERAFTTLEETYKNAEAMRIRNDLEFSVFLFLLEVEEKKLDNWVFAEDFRDIRKNYDKRGTEPTNAEKLFNALQIVRDIAGFNDNEEVLETAQKSLYNALREDVFQRTVSPDDCEVLAEFIVDYAKRLASGEIGDDWDDDEDK